MAITATVDKDVDRLERELGEMSKAFNRSKACTRALTRNLASVSEIKDSLTGFEDDVVYAEQCWNEIEYQDQCDLMLAPSFGGCFTTRERAAITSFWRITTEEAGL